MRTIIFVCICLMGFACSSGSKGEADSQVFGEEEILQNIINARGGEEKLRQVKTLSYTVSEANTGMNAQAFRKSPNKCKDIIEYPDPELVSTYIYDGHTAVMKEEGKTQVIEGFYLQVLKEDATIFPELHARELGYKYKYFGVREDDGKKVHAVEVNVFENINRLELYDYDTWLLHKKIEQIGSYNVIDEYTEIDGIKYMTAFRAVDGPKMLNFFIRDIKFNEEMDDSNFSVE